MNVREMHIDITQSLQQLGANRNRKIVGDELDWVINKQQDRLVSMAFPKHKDGRGFETDPIMLERVRELIVSREQPLNILDPYHGYSSFPPLFNAILEDTSQVRQLCNDPVPDTLDKVYQVTRFAFPVTTKVSAPFYQEVVVTKAGTEVFRLSTYINSQAETPYTGLRSKAEVFVIRDLVQQVLFEQGEEVHWQKYDTLIYPGHLLIVSPATFVITVDGTELTATTQSITRKVHVGTGKWKDNRLYSSADTRSLLNGAFSSTYYQSPVSEAMGNRLFVYMDNSFIVSNTGIKYIRRPRKISLILGLDCELTSEWVQRQICDLSVEYIMEIIKDPNWQVKLQDNIARTTI